MTTAPGPVIAVDLTPVLPGGDNGGAKVFTLALIPRLAAMEPTSRFVLLTQEASHDELAPLDAANVRRERVIDAATPALRPGALATAGRLLRHVPAPVRERAARAGYALHVALKRRAAAAALDRVRPDLLFCPFTSPALRRRGLPTACTVYDLQFAAYPQFFTVEDRVQRERAFRDACGATALAAISDHTRQHAMQVGGIPAERIRTIALRLPPPEPGGDAAWQRVASSHALSAGRYFVYPANFWRHKNHEMLLAAFGIATRALDPSVKLVLTGTGDRRAWLERAAARLGLEGRVVFTGFLSRDALAAVIAHATALVYPSLHEGFGLPLVEAMALGVPVACSDRTALPEVAGEAALRFDPRIPSRVAEALVATGNDANLRERLVAAGRRRAGALSDADRMAAEYWQLFRDAMR